MPSGDREGGPDPASGRSAAGEPPERVRLDRLLVERNLAPTRTRAQERIAAGAVSVEGTAATRPSQLVRRDVVLQVEPDADAYVSRGGRKLAAALDAWNISLSGRFCLDIGISSGGFTDCMLRRGAAGVIGVDVGHGQVAPALQNDPRLSLREGINARSMRRGDLPEGLSFLAMDVSFIAASLLLPPVVEAAFCGGASERPREAIVLVKPQFEAGREFVGRGGIVRDPRGWQSALERVQATMRSLGGQNIVFMDSPIPGGDGNREFLLYARF